MLGEKLAFKDEMENSKILKRVYTNIQLCGSFQAKLRAAATSIQISQPRWASFMKHKQNKFLCKNILHLI